jgi:hypothetical protein
VDQGIDTCVGLAVVGVEGSVHRRDDGAAECGVRDELVGGRGHRVVRTVDEPVVGGDLSVAATLTGDNGTTTVDFLDDGSTLVTADADRLPVNRRGGT